MPIFDKNIATFFRARTRQNPLCSIGENTKWAKMAVHRGVIKKDTDLMHGNTSTRTKDSVYFAYFYMEKPPAPQSTLLNISTISCPSSITFPSSSSSSKYLSHASQKEEERERKIGILGRGNREHAALRSDFQSLWPTVNGGVSPFWVGGIDKGTANI